MRCPKCDQQFEEGSRRFCPTDGSRLMPDAGVGSRNTGIFTSILQRSGVETTSIDDIGSGRAVENVSAPAAVQEPQANPNSEIFFELDDDLELELGGPTTPERIAPVVFGDTFGDIAGSTPIDRSAFKKVAPADIPKGHIDLNSAGRSTAFPEVEPKDPAKFIGRIVKGRYQVTEYIGGGDTGFAFIGEDRLGGDRKVLIKVFEAADQDDLVAAIIAEERVVLSHFSHPNIARLIDSGEFPSGQTFLVNEYFDSLSIEDSLSINGKLAPERTGRLIRQAGGALTEAHREGILHRDIRPGNMILDQTDDGETLRLVNFGVSNGDPTDHSVYYRSPEVVAGRVGTAASDTYSLAVTACEMLIGDVPFVGDTVREFQRAQNRGIDIDHLVNNFALPRSAVEVIAKGLSPEPTDRYPRAKDFGDALFDALKNATIDQPAAVVGQPAAAVDAEMERAFTVGEDSDVIIDQSTIASAPKTVVLEPAWKNRSPEPPQENASGWMKVALAGLALLFAVLAGGWIYLYYNPAQKSDVADSSQQATDQSSQGVSPLTGDIEVPPLERKLTQPPNTLYYRNTKQNLRGDLLRNFVEFTIFYPRDWKVNGPQSSTTAGTRGKFLDISRIDTEGRMREQMLVSYFPSKGTYKDDVERFPELVKETNETLKKILPDYQMVSEGETLFNGGWKAYEVKFQGGGTTTTGQKMMVWGRRIFIPAARPGTRNGFEITLLATSLAEGIASADDVGNKGELAPVLFSFEPGQNF